MPVWRPKLVGIDQGSEARKAVNDASKGQNSKRRIVNMEAFLEYEEWAHKSLVADMKIIKLGESIEKEMRAKGIAFIKVIPVEGRKVLIQFACVKDRDRCLTEDYRAILRNFTKFQRWSEGMMPKTRLVWISILGLLFRAWSEKKGEHLAAPHGKFLKMDDRDVRFVGVGQMRMLIEKSKVESDVPMNGMLLAKRLLTVQAGVQEEFNRRLELKYSVQPN